VRFESADYFRGLDLAKPETYRVAKRNGGGSDSGKTGDFGVRKETSPACSTKEEEDEKPEETTAATAATEKKKKTPCGTGDKARVSISHPPHTTSLIAHTRTRRDGYSL
jgi:hypothetical protein